MTLFAPLIIWLAKFLIQYFLDSNLQLKRELDEAIKRDEEYKNNLAELEVSQKQYDLQIQQKTDYLIEQHQIVLKLNDDMEKLKEEKNEKLKQVESNVSGLSDDDVLHHSFG